MRKGAGGFNIGSIAILIIPLLLLLTKDKGLSLNLDLGDDIDNKRDLIKNIKPYFSFQEQSTLNKVQDIIDIVSKIKNLTSSKYEANASSLSDSLPNDEKRERILEEISKHLEGKGKEIADNLLETSKRVKEARQNLDEHKKVVAAQDINKMEKVLNLVNSIEPIMHNKGKHKIRKIEKVLEVIKTPEEEF